MEFGSPVENRVAMKDPLSERIWMVRRRMMGRRRSSTGLRSYVMNSVMASPWSPSNVGTTITSIITTTMMAA
ncbi:hypothetical protein ACS0TY_021805 [Phlomoides rotata]